MSKKKTESHPNHTKHLKRLKRVIGQMHGIEKMITEGRYCPDILIQFKAAQAALRSIEAEIFKTHLDGCLRSAFESGKWEQAQSKVTEILKLTYDRKSKS